MRRARLLLLSVLCGLLTVVAATTVAQAAEDTKNISRSYNATKDIRGGSLVSLVKGSADTIEATNTENSARLVGVTVASDASLIAVDPDEDKVQVAMSGVTTAMVSNVNGAIKTGDRIAVSPFSGIGMKALGKGYIVGSALEDFNAAANGSAMQKVTDKNGDTKSIAIGYIQINLTPRYDSSAKDELNGLQEYVETLTGRVVSMPRIIISAIVAAVTIIGAGVLLYASIYGSIMSIGRNPLARQSILSALSKVLIMILVSVCLASLLIFMLLR